ncbi:MAG: prepilin-type N-terminal cleavage/methylation domain-containing protein [Colwellia sp.]|nr:prepilin-type N-terminal cleavage/methylation domain-containing protein [Colwellia sp.]
MVSNFPLSFIKNKQSGFTLIEVIVGIVVLSISLALVMNLIVPAEQQSVDQVHQIKAAELGQGMLDEILGRAFDEQSDMVGSIWRCDEEGRTDCTDADDLGAEVGENSRAVFNDVDDYNDYSSLDNSTDNDLDDGYNSFEVDVDVQYDGITLGLSDIRLAKRITVTVTTPLKTKVTFAGYKSNF